MARQDGPLTNWYDSPSCFIHPYRVIHPYRRASDLTVSSWEIKAQVKCLFGWGVTKEKGRFNFR